MTWLGAWFYLACAPVSVLDRPEFNRDTGGYGEADLQTPPPAVPSSRAGFAQKGWISLYRQDFEGRKTASGEIYHGQALTCAHRTLPFNTMVQVTNLRNGKSVIVKVNDRGPFHGRRILDISYEAARQLGMLDAGTVKAKVVVL